MNVQPGQKGFVSVPVETRFWNRVVKGPACWTWTGSTDGRYGEVWFRGRKQKAHRIAWELEAGPIPDGLDVCHTCDNPSCVRPGHLFLGTARDNARDAQRKGRLYNPNPLKSVCWRGHQLTDENVYVDKRGWRSCKPCKIERQRQARAALRGGVE